MNKLISFEGVDGVGKPTQIKLFLEQLKNNNMNYLLFREPGGTILSEKIREILLDNNNDMSNLSETLLFLAARTDLVKKEIKPNLKNDNTYVVCDRFLDSTLAYQAYGRGVDLKLIQDITLKATDQISPSTTFLLDADIDLSLSRITTKDRMEKEGKDFLLKVKNGFLELAKLNKNRYVIIDANKTISEIQNCIWKEFCGRYLEI